MDEKRSQTRPVWARWKLQEDGSVNVVGTYSASHGYQQREHHFASLDQAAETLGPSFREVVERVREAGLNAGRWRP